MLVGCASNTKTQPLAVEPGLGVDLSRQQMDAYQKGRADMRDEFKKDPAFHVPNLALEGFDNRNPTLPERGTIDDIQFWRALRRGNTTRENCGIRLDAAQSAIYDMLHTVRDGK